MSNAFGETADPGAYVPRPSFEAALSALTGLPRQEPPACAALIGEAGLGKTLALRIVAERLRSSFESLYVPFPRLEPEEFWAWVADALQMRRSEDDRSAVLKRCRGLAARGTGFVLLIDDAAELPLLTRVEVIAACRTEGFAAVMAFASDDHAELSELPEHVRRIELGPPMTQDETRAYIAARLRHAGQSAEGAALLEPGRIAELHAQSEGVPGRLHALLEPWLARAAREATPAPPREPTREAQRPPPLEPARPQPPPPVPPARAQAPAEPPLPPPRPPAPAEPPRTPPPPPPSAAEKPTAPAPPPVRPAAATAPAAPPAAEAPRRAPMPPAPRGGGPLRRAPIAVAAVLLGLAGGLWYALSGGEPEERPIAESPAPLAATAPTRELAVPEPAPIEPAPEPAEEAAEAPALGAEEPDPEPELAAPLEPEPPPVAVVTRPEPAPAPAPTAALPAPAPSPRAEPAPVRPPPEAPRTAAATPPAPAPAAEPPRVAPAPPPSGTRLNVNAIPWAEIEVDGRRVGQTPLGDLPLTPGTHRVTARLPDGRVLERSVEARGGELYVVFP